jgi:hypothetical protein
MHEQYCEFLDFVLWGKAPGGRFAYISLGSASAARRLSDSDTAIHASKMT